MLAHLDSTAWTIILTFVMLIAFWIGWIADALLDKLAMGVVSNTTTTALGAVIGLFGLDWLFRNTYVPLRYASAYTWFGFALLGGTLALILLCGLKSVLRR